MFGHFDACTKQFPPKEKVPHMGWNNFSELKSSKLLTNIALEDDVYYVHGYYAEVSKTHWQSAIIFFRSVPLCSKIILCDAVSSRKIS